MTRPHRSLRDVFLGLEWRVRAGAAILFFTLGLLALEGGVGVTRIQDLPASSTLTKVYYVSGLFLLGGLDLGVPHTGPTWAQLSLWIAYFGCPLVTTAAIVEGVVRTLRHSQSSQNLDGHTVVVGKSVPAEVFIDHSAHSDTDPQNILSVHHDPNSQFGSIEKLETEQWRIIGDVESRSFESIARLHTASSLLLLGERDLLNLEAFFQVAEHADSLPPQVAIHVSDIHLMRELRETSLLPDDVHLFNLHELAAENLIDNQIGPFFDRTPYEDEVIIAGFGRFGQSMLKSLDDDVPDQFDRVTIIDQNADLLTELFGKQVDLDGDYTVSTETGDIRDPEIWRDRLTEPDEPRKTPAIILGVDDDALNIRVALWLRHFVENDAIFARTDGANQIARELAQAEEFKFVNTRDRMRRHIAESDDFQPERVT